MRVRRAAARAALAAVAASAGLAAAGGCGGGGDLPSRQDLNILFITLDTTRRDHLGCYGYQGVKTPHLDGLAAAGILFEEGTSPVPLTCPAHSTMFTGVFPPQHGVRNNGGFSLKADRTTLAEILKEHGYRTGAFTAAYVLNRVFGLNQGFDEYDDDLSGGEQSVQEGVFTARERRGEAVVAQALAWLKEKPQEKFFLWTHFYDAHHPYNPPSPYREQYQHDPYAGEIAYLDEQVGKLLTALEELGVRDRTMVVAVGDHGESLHLHGESNHAYFIYDSTILIPYIIAVPPARGLELPRGKRLAGQVRLVDLMPTILSVLELPAPEGIQGVTLLPYMMEGKDVPGFDNYCETLLTMLDYGWSDLIGVRTSRWKYIDAPQRELYDLERDPWELDNLAGTYPDMVEEMRGKLARLLAGESGQDAEAFASMEMSDEMRQSLQSLGYLGGAGEAPAARVQAVDASGIRTPEGRDPKDMVQVFGPVTAAMSAMYRRDWDEAIRHLSAALAIEEQNKQAHRFLGDCYLAKGLPAKAEEHYRRALLLDPNKAEVLNNLGALLTDQKKFAEAQLLLGRAVSLRPSSADVHNNLAAVRIHLLEFDKALPFLEEALRLDPSMTAARINLALCYDKTGRLADSVRELETVVKEQPGNQDMQVQLRASRRRLEAARAAGGA